MNSLPLIDNVLNPNFKISDNYLIEDQAKMKIELIQTGCRNIVFQLDQKLGREYKGGMFPFFNSSNQKVTTVCDYLIFSEYKNKIYALIVELKKGDQNTNPQLKAGECFIDFVVATVNRINNTNLLIEKKKISIKEFKRKKNTKEMEVKYDSNNHHFFEQSKFRILSFLQ